MAEASAEEDATRSIQFAAYRVNTRCGNNGGAARFVSGRAGYGRGGSETVRTEEVPDRVKAGSVGSEPADDTIDCHWSLHPAYVNRGSSGDTFARAPLWLEQPRAAVVWLERPSGQLRDRGSGQDEPISVYK